MRYVLLLTLAACGGVAPEPSGAGIGSPCPAGFSGGSGVSEECQACFYGGAETACGYALGTPENGRVPTGLWADFYELCGAECDAWVADTAHPNRSYCVRAYGDSPAREALSGPCQAAHDAIVDCAQGVLAGCSP